MLYAERHRPRGVGVAGTVHRTWAVAEKNDWHFSNPRIDTGTACIMATKQTCQLAAAVFGVARQCSAAN